MSADATGTPASLAGIHTLVLDLDDTLFPERDFALGGFAAAGEWLRAQHGIEGFASQAVALFAAGRRGRIFDETLHALAVPASPVLVETLITQYRAHRPRLSFFPDARQLLAWADGRLNLALITDGFEAVQRSKIAALGLDAMIECRIVTDSLGGREFWKPNPTAFRLVMQRFAGEPSGYVYVADNPRKDFIAPKALGWRTVRVRRPDGEHAALVVAASDEAELVLPDLSSLPARLRAGLRAP